jgi:hypothetical protein
VDFANYDLMVIAYQVWFLSPSLPVQALLQSEIAPEIFKDKQVVALCTCRNLWYSASRLMHQSLEQLGAKWLTQITVCERSPLWASFVTTPRWMLTGRRDAFAFFPAAGISESDFRELQSSLMRFIQSWSVDRKSPEVLKYKSNLDRLSLRCMDRFGRGCFEIWAALIVRYAPREGLWQDVWLVLFRANLVLVILSVGLASKLLEIVYGRDLKPWHGSNNGIATVQQQE